jgi:hypothetical protein
VEPRKEEEEEGYRYDGSTVACHTLYVGIANKKFLYKWHCNREMINDKCVKQ